MSRCVQAERSASDNRLEAPPARVSPRQALWLLLAAGLIVRLGLALLSTGSNDAETWLRFTREFRQHGFLQTYVIDDDFNHPPIPALWAWGSAILAGGRLWPFTVVFKLLPIAADAASVVLLYAIWSARRQPGLAIVAAAAFAFSPNAVLVSAFHCNTDCCYAMLCLLAVYLMDLREKFFLAGLALAAAINVKLIPVLLIPPLLLSCRSWNQGVRFVLGLGVGALPFLAPLLVARQGFIDHVIHYGSYIDRWGIPFFFMSWRRQRFDAGSAGGKFILFYSNFGRTLIPLVMVGWALLCRRRWVIGRQSGPNDRPAPTKVHVDHRSPTAAGPMAVDRFDVAAGAFALFLILTPGFGVQYTAIVGPLLLASRPRAGIVYAITAGLFIGVAYAAAWPGGVPLSSHFHTQTPFPIACIGAVSWLTLIAFVVALMRRPGATRARSAEVTLHMQPA